MKRLVTFSSAGDRLAGELLDCRPPLTQEEILRAFRQAALDAHPDHGGHPRFFRAVVLARDLLLASLQRPAKRPKWRTSSRGNYWRHFDDVGNVTVFRTSDGTWRYVSDGGYSEEEWSTAKEAMDAADEEY